MLCLTPPAWGDVLSTGDSTGVTVDNCGAAAGTAYQVSTTAGWLHVGEPSTGMTKGVFTLMADSNQEPAERSAEVIVNPTNFPIAPVSFHVTQGPNSSIPGSGEEFTVTVKGTATEPWTATKQQDIEDTFSSGVGKGPLNFIGFLDSGTYHLMVSVTSEDTTATARIYKDTATGDIGPLPGGPYQLPALSSAGVGGGDSGVGEV